MNTQTWLALGDSYTIGEGLPLYESYPYQALQMLRAAGRPFHAPEIIARTGWTSQELIQQLEHTRLQPAYDYVSLLIGVNNQYRGLPEAAFTESVEWLAEKALQLNGALASRIIVLSIPDWGVTPFGTGRDTRAAIDRHNDICKEISARKGFHYIDITTEYRRTGGLPESVTADDLHPSAGVHRYWAAEVVKCM